MTVKFGLPLIVSGLLAVALAACEPPRDEPGFSGTWVDLTHAFSRNAVFWPTAATFTKETVSEGMTEGGWFYSAYNFASSEHGGTHMDAPVHFAKGALATHEVPLDSLIGPAAVIDVSDASAQDRDYQFTVDDVLNWEKENGALPDGAIILFNTGYAAKWPDAEAYMGTAMRGPAAVGQLHFPGLSPELATFLTEERNIRAVGLDTPSLDYGQSKTFMTHRILSAKNIPGFENVAALDQLPATGATIVALPMKIQGGSGGPLRIVAHLPNP